MRKTLSFLLLLLLLAAAAWSWHQWQQREPMPEGLILASGRLEGDRHTVASKLPGRVVALLAREGDEVAAGQVLVRLDDAQARARAEQARARVAAARASLAAARNELEVLRRRVPLEIDTAKAGVAHAEAALAAAKARAHQARKDARRYAELAKTGAMDKYAADQAELGWEVARADLATAMAALDQARKRLAEAELGHEEIRSKEYQVAVTEAQLAEAEAVLDEAQSLLADLEVKAPVAGTLVTRIVDAGEVVSAGSPLFTLVDLDRLYLKVYVPEKEIGRLRRGLEARIYTDAFPDHPFPARVRYIADRAQFTPKEVQTPDERVKLVYAVKLYLDENPDHRLTPGLPADAVIRWREGVPWTSPRW
jgi:Multidrug resistance efflux pump